MGVLEYSVWIQAAPEKVWGTYVDPTRIPDWQTGKPVIGEVQGAPGEPGSRYVSRRGPLAARTTVLTADVPRELVTRTDASFGLEFEVTSLLSERSGRTDLQLRAATRWRRRWGPVAKIVERVILIPREARKGLILPGRPSSSGKPRNDGCPVVADPAQLLAVPGANAGHARCYVALSDAPVWSSRRPFADTAQLGWPGPSGPCG